MRTRDFLFVCLAGVLWGGGGTLGAVFAQQSSMTSLSVAMWRLLIGGVVLVAVLAVVRPAAIARWRASHWRAVTVFAVLSAVYQGLYFSAVTLAGVGVATLTALGSVPVFVTAWDALRHRRLPGARSCAALVVALAGLGLVMSGSVSVKPGAVWGVVLALGVGATFAAITVTNRGRIDGLDPIAQVGVGFAIGGVLLLPIAVLAGISAPHGGPGWALAGALAIMSTAVPYVLYFLGLRTVPAFVATVVVLLEPLVGVILGVFILRESLNGLVVVGALALATAVLMLRPQRDTQGLSRVKS